MSIATSVRPIVTTSSLDYSNPGSYFQGALGMGGNSYVDSYATYGAIANKYQSAAENTLAEMLNAAKQNLAGMNGNNATINGSIDSIRSQADKVNEAALNIGTQAGAVGDYAGKVAQTADSLTPYAQALRDYAASVFNQGQTLLGYGSSMLDEWNKFKPIVGDYITALQRLDPNRQVSLAAHDVQASFQNTQDQNMRTMARMGVDPSSGAYQAQKAKWDQALAVALAGAKTKARNSGLTEQLTQLAQGLNLGASIAGQGANIGQTGASVIGQAGNLMGQGANVVQAQGSLFGTAGNLEATAGNLYGTQSSAYAQAGQLQQAAGELAAQLNIQTMEAQKILQDAYASMAAYNNSQAAGYAELAGRYGFLRGASAISGNGTNPNGMGWM